MLFRSRCFSASRDAFHSAIMPHAKPKGRKAVLAVSITTAPKTAPKPEGAPVPVAGGLTPAIGQVANFYDDPSPNVGPCEVEPPAPGPYITPRCLSIVTGASRGLGAAIARVLTSRGPPLPSVPTKGGTIAASASADGVAAACGGGSIHDPTTSVVSATTAPATSSASTAATAWSHDIILLASDRSRLGQFVQAELAPLLVQQQQQQQQQRLLFQQGQMEGQRQSQQATEPQPVPSLPSLLSSPPPQQQQQRQPQAATAAAPAQQAEPSSPRLRGVTHIRTACFDLGDLEGLETHIVRLLSPASTKPATDAGPAGNGNNGIGSEDMPVKHPSQAASWLATSTSTSVAADGGGGGGSEGAGLLPLPPSAYTHVLLVHNAGQVGDLVPLELQVLANIRRQTDLNVTSFAHLTAAVLRTFLYTPRLEPPPVPASADAATEASEPTSSQQPPGQQHSQQPQPPGQQQQQQDRQDHQSRQRRVITIVNISSVSVDQPYEHFSLYGMGKAARHMIVRSVAHEAALRETGGLVETAAAAAKGASAAAAAAAAAVGGAPLQWECSPGNTTGGGGGGGGGLQPAAVARVRALSYAPGAIDTEMQAAAREALPAGSLKSRFEDNARNGRLVDPRVSAQVLYDILAADAYDNGGHVDYYSAAAVAGTGGSVATTAPTTTASSHPLARHG